MKLEYIVKFVFKASFLAGLIYFKSGEWFLYQPDSSFTKSPLFLSVLNFIIFWLAINIIIRLNQFIYRKRKKLGDKYSDNVIVGLQNIYFLLTGFGVIVMLLGMFGVEFTKLLTALSIVAAALAIISKDIVSDILTGFIISFSKDIALGDYVKIADLKGKVIDINIYKIVLLSEEGELIYIPNSKAYFSEIINYSKVSINLVHLNFTLNINVFKSTESLEKTITDSLGNYITSIEANSIKLHIDGLNKEEVNFNLTYQLLAPDSKLEQKINNHIYSTILKTTN